MIRFKVTEHVEEAIEVVTKSPHFHHNPGVNVCTQSDGVNFEIESSRSQWEKEISVDIAIALTDAEIIFDIEKDIRKE